MKLNSDELTRVATFFRAFAEPTRLALLQELKNGECTVGELVETLPTTQANISKQLRTLFEAGLVERRKEGTSVIYSVCEPAVLELCRIACDKLNRDARPKKLQF
jgi:DNA-binding transcriptional ArsR family regulator